MMRWKAKKLLSLCEEIEKLVTEAKMKAVYSHAYTLAAKWNPRICEEWAADDMKYVKEILKDIHAKIENYLEEEGESVELTPREEGGEER